MSALILAAALLVVLLTLGFLGPAPQLTPAPPPGQGTEQTEPGEGS